MRDVPLRVVLDANVLFPFTLRDTLLRGAAAGFFQLFWSRQILDEMERNLLSSRRMSKDKSGRLRAQMEKAFPEAMVSGFEALIPSMPNQEKDRHVSAAAVKARAAVIVTANVKDFRRMPEGIEVRSPDVFLCGLLNCDPEGMVVVLREQAAALKNPPRSLGEIVRGLGKMAPAFERAVTDHLGG